MSNTKYVVQIWGTNRGAMPYWMNVAHRGTKKSAEAERDWLVAHGTKQDNVRIVKI